MPWELARRPTTQSAGQNISTRYPCTSVPTFRPAERVCAAVGECALDRFARASTNLVITQARDLVPEAIPVGGRIYANAGSDQLCVEGSDVDQRASCS